LAAQALVVGSQFAIAGQRDLQAAGQGSVAAALVGRCGLGERAAIEVAQPFDLGTDVGLGVEPVLCQNPRIGCDLWFRGSCRMAA
jgi:hypothetical protein